MCRVYESFAPGVNCVRVADRGSPPAGMPEPARPGEAAAPPHDSAGSRDAGEPAPSRERAVPCGIGVGSGRVPGGFRAPTGIPERPPSQNRRRFEFRTEVLVENDLFF